MDRFFKIIKKAGWVAVQSFVLALLLSGNIWLLYTNFAALKVSFEYGGYDMTPVGEDFLTGFIWESFGLYELTLAHMFAAAMAFFVFFLSAVVSHHTYITIRLLLERKEYARLDDAVSLEQANAAIVRHIAYLCFALVVLIPIAVWDMQQFRFRTIVPLLGMENNPAAVKDWPFVLQQYGNLFAVQLVRVGAWAYIFLIIGAGLLFELWITYVKEALVRLGTAIRAWYEYISGTAPDNVTAAYQNARQPELSDRVYTAPSAGNAFADDVEEQKKTMANNPEGGNGNGNVEWPEKPTVEPIYMASTGDNQNADEEVTVYGGRPGERIKFSAAAADPENYYIDEMRRVWRRTFSSGVHDEEQAEAA
jgi:hypothetical protein